MKTAVVAIAKHESKYMKEWVEYYTNLGIDQFFIINNEDYDDHSQDETIAGLKKSGYDITQFNVRGVQALADIGMQRGAYNHVYNFVRHNKLVYGDIEWLAFVDLDEFIYLDGNNIKDFLNRDVFKDTTVIHLNWRIYGDNGNLYSSDKPVQERFTEQCPLDASYNGDEKPKGVLENMFVKSIVRIVNDPICVDVHTTYFNNEGPVCRRADGTVSNWRYSADRLDSSNYYVKHYITKSLEEYIDRRCVVPGDAAHHVTPVEKRIEWYFNINEKTPEKVAYVKERLGLEV